MDSNKLLTPPEGQTEHQVLPREAKDSGYSTPTREVRLLVKSLVSIQETHKGPPSGRQIKIVCKTVGRKGRSSLSSGSHPIGLLAALQRTPQVVQVSMHNQWIYNIDKNNALSTSIHDLLAKNAIEEVNRVDCLGFYSWLFLVPKPGNWWRPVIDLSSLNQYIIVLKFKMATPESICTSLRQGE